ncbi:hypothetical protein NHX12_018525 [Muraenolepis orangiensis]|uniref:L1 transposable element RRM domain-containing protein n=1 Tax=Muraenolepis orangiensis TaxID=630683 RepID=A0A9Q0EZP6_9TELE|nr:hypothetical protein NHX12_018525 [Muraenolepis orangiensis]
MSSFNSHLIHTEILREENVGKVTEIETAVETLRTQYTTLQNKVDDLEKRLRCLNLRIINIPEGSEKDRDPTKFVSDLLMKVIGADVLGSSPEIERAHRSLGPRPGDTDAAKPRAFIVKFLRFQEKEKVLRWARQHKLHYQDSELRIYQDISADLAKRRAAFNGVKNSLYLKGICFRLIHPAVFIFHSVTRRTTLTRHKMPRTSMTSTSNPPARHGWKHVERT